MGTDRESASGNESTGRQLTAFLRAVHDSDYLDAKADDFAMFTRLALLVTAAFVAAMMLWDYAIDPADHWRAAWLRMFECGAVLVWAMINTSRVPESIKRGAALAVPLAVEAAFIEILAILDRGSLYGIGGFLYFFIFVPFLVLAQPFALAATVLAAITVFPIAAAAFGLSAGLDWPIYNAYMWMGLVPVVLILLLFEYLYWQVFRYRLQVAAQAVTDDLTGIANRRHFTVEGLRSLVWHQRDRRQASLLFVDIDCFKIINDDHGHFIGDAALCHVVNTLSAQLRTSDLMARYGGEEFVILLPDTDAAAAASIAERMRAGLAGAPLRPAVAPDDELALTVSIGVATYRPPAQPDIDRLIHDADLALYAAKRRGRNRVVHRVTLAEREVPDQQPPSLPVPPQDSDSASVGSYAKASEQ